MEPEKIQKTLNPLRFKNLHQIAKLLRFIEAAGALILISYSSSYIPAVAKHSGDLLRRAAALLISPTFVFLLANAIVLFLFAKSRHVSHPETAPLPAVDLSGDLSGDVLNEEEEEIVFEDKEVCVEIRASEVMKVEEADIVVVAEEGKGLPEKENKAEEEEKGEVEEDAEQFRRTIEEFIAKQQRFQRQESLTMVPYSAGLPEPVAV